MKRRLNALLGPQDGSLTRRGPGRIAYTLAGLVLFGLVLGTAGRVVLSVRQSAAMFVHPFQFDESEGMIVAETLLLLDGVNIFDPVTPDMFISAPYPPLFYLLAVPGQALLGEEPTFKVGRALSILATLLIAASLFGIVSRLTSDLLAAGVGAGAWLSLGLVTFWGSLVKPDMLAIAFGIMGLYWVVARPPSAVWGALPFLLAAFYTKQTAIAAAVAVVGWLVLTRPRTGLAFGVLLGIGALVPSVLLNVATRGGYYYHIVTVHELPWFSNRFVLLVSQYLESYGVLVIPGTAFALALGAGWLLRPVRGVAGLQPRSGALLVFIYVAASVLTASGAGTHGGNHNHFLEWSAASCLALGVGLGTLRQMPGWRMSVAAGLVGLFILAGVPGLFKTSTLLDTELNMLDPVRVEGMMNIFQYVTNNGGPAYSDNVGLMLTTGKRLWTTDPFTQTHATFYGRWDESKLVQAIKSRHFSQIVLRIDVEEPQAGAGDVSPAILQAVRDNYKLDQRNVENIYVPR